MESFDRLAGIDKMLKNTNTYPSREELAQFPLGEHLLNLDVRTWTNAARIVELRDNEPDSEKEILETQLKKPDDRRLLIQESLERFTYRRHIKKTMDWMRIITSFSKTDSEEDVSDKISELGEQYKELVEEYKKSNKECDKESNKECDKESNKECDKESNKECDKESDKKSDIKTIIEFWKKLNCNERMFLRFAAFYHDIGKAIFRERHPALGRHLLESLSDEDSQKLRDILGEKYYMLLHLVAYHDLFGVVNTGEASLLVLLDAAGITSDKKMILKTIQYIATINIADVYAVVPPERFVKSLTNILNDLKVIANLLNIQSSCPRSMYQIEFERSLIQYALQPEQNAERIKRFLVVSMGLSIVLCKLPLTRYS